MLLCSSMATSRGCWCLCISVEASASCRKMIRFHQTPPTKKKKQGLLCSAGPAPSCRHLDFGEVCLPRSPARDRKGFETKKSFSFHILIIFQHLSISVALLILFTCSFHRLDLKGSILQVALNQCRPLT